MKSKKISQSQKGRKVIHKGSKSKRVFVDELAPYLADGWFLGFTDITRNSMSIKRLGKSPWNKGVTAKDDARVHKIVECGKATQFHLGDTPWNKGLSADTDAKVMEYTQRGIKTRESLYGSSFPNNNMNDSHKAKLSAAQKGKKRKSSGPCSEETKLKISKAKRGHPVSDDTRSKISASKKGKRLSEDALRIKLTKAYATRKANNSFNVSADEENFYRELLENFSGKTVYRQYKDDTRYPFYCDFYILEDDLFIELNAHWTHGGRPFDSTDESCIKQLREWEEKAKTSQFYKNAIETWTVRDVKKSECATKNKLNYKCIY